MDAPLVSICVPHWNHARDLLEPFLKNMLATTDKRTEIVVVDNGSTDTSWDILLNYQEQYPGRIKAVKSDKNLGFAGGSNLAFTHAKGEYIIFLNNDVKADKKGWVDDFLRVNQSYPNAVLGPQLVKDNSWTTVLNYGMISYINGWCMFFPRTVLNQIGLFDRGVGQAFFEDVELCDRAVKAGFELIQVNATGLQHLGSQTIKDFDAGELTEKARKYFRAKIIINKIIHTGSKRIVFYVPNNYAFIDSDWEGKGVGGAEYALIHLTRQLAKLGYEVWVYNKCSVQGTFNGVNYAHFSTFEYADYSDIFILFREPIRHLPFVNAGIKIFWSCDQQTTGMWDEQIWPYVDRVVAISPYHKNYLVRNKNTNPEFVESIDLGIDEDSYSMLPQKKPGQLIFCSVPHRGLTALKELFPKIRAKVPHATLIITSDYTLWGVPDPDNHQYKEMANMEGVTFLGKISRKELVRHQLESEVMAYPCTYEELFCVAAAECIAAGAVPVSAPIGALTTTIADSGILIRKGMGDFNEAFVNAVVDLLTNDKLRLDLMKRGRERMLVSYNWSVITAAWTKLFSEITEHKKRGGDSLWIPHNKNVK